MKRLFGATKADIEAEANALRIEAERAHVLVEESMEIVIVLDSELNVLAASRRAREAIDGLVDGSPLPAQALAPSQAYEPVNVPYEVDGRRETLVYLRDVGDLSAYEELRVGFTAAVSHELRTPLARLLALLETASLPGEDPAELLEQGRLEVEHMGELIDDVLFLSELETGRTTVFLGLHDPEPVLDEVAEELREQRGSGRRHARLSGGAGSRGPSPTANAEDGRREPGRECNSLRRSRGDVRSDGGRGRRRRGPHRR